MLVTLIQRGEGSPNFCFGLYRSITATRREARLAGVKRWSVMTRDELREAGHDRCVKFVQSDWDYISLAESLGWVSPKPCDTLEVIAEMISVAFDYLENCDGRSFRLSEV